MSNTKERLDLLLVEKGMFPSREKARAAIMAGDIYVNGMKITKCGHIVKKEDSIEFKGNTMPYVSRGGYKLEKAIKSFNIQLEGKTCMDIGASTGGFTDCMLQNGAAKVYAIDVGYGQFAWKLRIDPRVVSMERTNIRYVTPEDLQELCDFASIDVSFISLSKVLPAAKALLKESGEIIALIKPQFEAGRDKVGKKGVVREKSTHKEVISNVINFAISENFNILGLDYSPIKGPEGNIEYLIYLKKGDNENININESLIDDIVEASHNDLD
ncbi:MAG: TlyA family RNA methyltransferase [Clostridiales bacterium]|uniref:TlyA family RNA methyltransferase n=1 Tax=Clostridium sp. N3C TaxID=1776758 RepID=UPI00092DEF06|nr:TlyA family RNA methyltransferase [Clostridium sp. N3C]NLZ47374.1 TlyA family RNA methyltransferase [Clostridiales bacterium]SCN21387.1 16S/23S rRNA (cytidine-2'-O)-methyltransferase TlyA [Clostridium sp. N3C]